MHDTLVHALSQGTQGPGTKPGAGDQAWDPKRPLGRSKALDRCLFGSQAWSLAPGFPGSVHAQECCACTRVLCMHKNLVHAQESWACKGVRRLAKAFKRPAKACRGLQWLAKACKRYAKACKGLQKACEGMQRPAKACKGLQSLATACERPPAKAIKGLQKACKGLQRSYQPKNIPSILENPAMAKCQKHQERKVFEL